MVFDAAQLRDQWPQIRDVVRQANVLVLASVSPEGFPHMTPIGSLHLGEDCAGHYLERFPVELVKNIAHSDRVEVLALNSKPSTWLRAMLKGRFDSLPGLRLRGRAGARREATPEERERWAHRVRRLRWMKGHDLLWSEMRLARDLHFDAYTPIRLGAMTHGLGLGT